MNDVDQRQSKDPEALAAAMTAAGLEHGFAGLDLRAEIASLARARLGLLEEKGNGRLPLPPDFFVQRLRRFDDALATREGRRVRVLLLHAGRGMTAWRLRRAEQRHRRAEEWVARRLPVLLASYDIACRRAACARGIQMRQVSLEECRSC